MATCTLHLVAVAVLGKDKLGKKWFVWFHFQSLSSNDWGNRTETTLQNFFLFSFPFYLSFNILIFLLVDLLSWVAFFFHFTCFMDRYILYVYILPRFIAIFFFRKKPQGNERKNCLMGNLSISDCQQRTEVVHSLAPLIFHASISPIELCYFVQNRATAINLLHS